MTEEDKHTIQALRNLWPLLSPHARKQATNLANYLKGRKQ